MSQQIEYRPGQPQTFIATKSFELGTTGLKAMKGIPIQFDGSRVTIDGHPSVVLPTLRGAIRMGWLVPAEQFDYDAPAPRPVSAGVQVRPAEGGNPMDAPTKKTITTDHVESEERVVTDVAAHAEATRQNNQGNYRRQDGMTVVVEAQDGVEVRKVNSPTHFDTDLEKISVDAAIREANKIKAVAHDSTMTREEMMAGMDEDSRAQYAADIASRKIGHVPEEAAQIVATLDATNKVQDREGMKITGSVGGGIAIHDAGGTGGQASITKTTSEGMAFTNTNGPGTVKQPVAEPANGSSNDAQARVIARSICPDFPDNYRFGDPIRKKIARLQADFDDRPDVIRAVAAADTDQAVRTRLLEEFPDAFG